MTVWTEDRVELLKRRVGEGVSYTDIGIEIGVARGAIAGKVTRLGIGRGAPAQSRSSRAIKKPRGNPNGGLAFKVANGTLGKKTALKVAGPPRPRADVPLSESLRVPLLLVRDDQCKFPDGGFLDPARTFCGHPVWQMKIGDVVVSRKPYCESHCNLAYQPVTERQRRPDGRLARAACA